MAAIPLILGLDEIVKHGSAKKRAATITKLSELFVQGAPIFGPQHVELFDGILIGLVPSAELSARAGVAARFASLSNAPPSVVDYLAREDEIQVAGPILSRSPLVTETALIEIARAKGQAHLAAISERDTIAAPVTDVILRRADREVVRVLAKNSGANFSQAGYSGLINRAAEDGVLALSLGQREDISPEGLKELLSRSVDVVRRRMFETAKPKQRIAINQAMLEISSAPRARLVKRDFAPAQRFILALHRSGGLNEAALLNFAKEHKYEEAVAAVSAMSGVPILTVDQLILGDRYDPILLIARGIGLEWATARALIVLRLGPGKMPSPPDIEEARLNYERLSSSTAQRVLVFWRARGK
ncbi:DUF2336 domain-containing protein [Afipia carboxidovorans]|uniref:DUF2336 domain-containing protein n=1 Tax=Afipia carboxidovorans TaxID=40137 RepID=UPI0030922D8C|nr:DUF2336 domain-containing protein [Afipia carboxidovorans]